MVSLELSTSTERTSGLSSAVHSVHRFLKVAGDKIANYSSRVRNGRFNICRLSPGWSSQHIVHHRLTSSPGRTGYTQPQAPEVTPAHCTHDVAKAIVPGVPATLLQPHHTRLQVQLIMNNKDLLQSYPEIFGETGYRLATSIHESGWLQQPALSTFRSDLTGLSVKFRLLLEAYVKPPHQCVGKPKAGVVTSFGVLCSRIT